MVTVKIIGGKGAREVVERSHCCRVHAVALRSLVNRKRHAGSA